MILLRILFGLGVYVLVAYAVGRNLRAMSLHYPAVAAPKRKVSRVRSAAATLPATLPQRVPGILLHAMKS